jgi:hypothetical protein
MADAAVYELSSSESDDGVADDDVDGMIKKMVENNPQCAHQMAFFFDSSSVYLDSPGLYLSQQIHGYESGAHEAEGKESESKREET